MQRNHFPTPVHFWEKNNTDNCEEKKIIVKKRQIIVKKKIIIVIKKQIIVKTKTDICEQLCCVIIVNTILSRSTWQETGIIFRGRVINFLGFFFICSNLRQIVRIKVAMFFRFIVICVFFFALIWLFEVVCRRPKRNETIDTEKNSETWTTL